MGRIRSYLAHDPADRRLICRSFVWLVMVDVILRVPPLRRLIRSDLTDTAAFANVVPAGLEQARRYAYWLELISRHHVVRARCLHRSLVLHRWLRHDGWPSTLRIGVRKEDGKLKAHAWVELGGHVINDSPGAIAPFTRLLRPEERFAWPGVARARPGQRLGLDWTGVSHYGRD